MKRNGGRKNRGKGSRRGRRDGEERATGQGQGFCAGRQLGQPCSLLLAAAAAAAACFSLLALPAPPQCCPHQGLPVILYPLVSCRSGADREPLRRQKRANAVYNLINRAFRASRDIIMDQHPLNASGIAIPCSVDSTRIFQRHNGSRSPSLAALSAITDAPAPLPL
jgi:hypothetical protein